MRGEAVPMGIGRPPSLAVPFAVVAAAYAGRRRAPGSGDWEGEKKPRKPGRSAELRAFLQMNAQEGFDLEGLNSLDLREIGREAARDKDLLSDVLRQVETLMPRVRSETETTSLAGAILRTKALDWYRRSPYPGWAEKMAPRWAGIFFESKVPGGRLSPKLTVRLSAFHAETAKASGWWGSILRSRGLAKLVVTALKRPMEPLMPHVAQAFLDDLAANRRTGERPLGLERLSEVARHIGTPEMNRLLAELFPHEGVGPVIVIDPRYHPDIGGVAIRPPNPKATGDAIVYALGHSKVSHPRDGGGGDAEAAALDDAPVATWERPDITGKDWLAVLAQFQRRKERLEAPPIENYRNQESYLRLRELILADSSALSAFMAVHWKGKPSGLVLLARLLSEGTLLPEAETDGDYLEGECGHIERGDPNHRPKDGRWRLGHGWIVMLKVAGSERSYAASRTSGAVRPRKD